MLHALIADDHAIVRKGLKQIIVEEHPSAQVDEAGDAETMLKKASEQVYDVIICDINMPGRTGIDALQQFKKQMPQVPVLVMSMYSEEQYAIRVLKAGAAGYLSKQSIHDDLIKAIETVINGKKFITPAIAEILAGAIEKNHDSQPHDLLSDREFDVFKLLAAGKSVSEIADQFSLSTTTISTYRSRLLEKMNLRSNSDLTRYAIEKNLI